MNINHVTLVGRVTKKPELRAMPSGSKVCEIGIATNFTWKDDSGAKKEKVQFTNVVFFAKRAEVVAQYVEQGQLLGVQGRLETQSWEKDGAKQYKTVVIADSFEFGPKKQGGSAVAASSEPAAIEYPKEDINPEDIPF